MQTPRQPNGNEYKKWKVFIVDNHPMVRARLAAFIQRKTNVEVCGDCMAPVALELIHQCGPDLVILDGSSERSGGLELLKKLSAQHPEVRILVLSLDGDRLHIERAFQAGASGYLTKQEAPARILSVIQDVLKGEPYVQEQSIS